MGSPPERLDQAMDQQRLQLGLEWRELAQRAPVSYETLRALRKTGVASALSKRRIETALGWAPGSIDTVLGGGVAEPAEPKPAAQLALEKRVALGTLEDRRNELVTDPRWSSLSQATQQRLLAEIAVVEARLRAEEARALAELDDEINAALRSE